ncbi:ribbon-helix-helix domain-containing protein [Oharaeibacter diazotrophicus]|uniref:Antitoxin-like ribbon-helix-helix domain-containing protein n=1 Tax=Oharaeibacter diazotrophicus TaxID=1920512 RepID=A0A4R6RPL0_9HYPH|nr:ribbon-helix-helix domain-containing protein [Oharaeibacter diazotrophicus]TDP88709.1 hypothetical protein EDD54_0005 [Oharaeibacter diazotrophicus]BBE74927.1 hypothetical protein OHA_3_00015 [Pleomorphomonas sp. SM30]GLS79211.1 hypothetical protein GCM10007904_45490 [Oharaeibacter diazotrophicus]
MAKTAKRSSLFASTESVVPEPAVEASAPAPVAVPTEIQPTGRKYPVARSREGKRVAATYLSGEALKQLKLLALKRDTTVQEILRDGLNLVFEREGMSRIA